MQRTFTVPGIVVKINLTNFTRVNRLILDTGENNLVSSVVSGSFAYFG